MEQFKQILKDIFLSKRAKALYWSAGTMLVAGLIGIATDVLQAIPVQSMGVVIAGLVLAQITKAINNSLSK